MRKMDWEFGENSKQEIRKSIITQQGRERWAKTSPDRNPMPVCSLGCAQEVALLGLTDCGVCGTQVVCELKGGGHLHLPGSPFIALQ